MEAAAKYTAGTDRRIRYDTSVSVSFTILQLDGNYSCTLPADTRFRAAT